MAALILECNLFCWEWQKDSWCGDEPLSLAFPTLFSLAVHKNDRVTDVWDSSRGGGGWSPIFSRSLNDWEVEEFGRFLSTLYRKRISPHQEELLTLKSPKDPSSL